MSHKIQQKKQDPDHQPSVFQESEKKRRTVSGDRIRNPNIITTEVTREELENIFLETVDPEDSYAGHNALEMLDTLPPPRYMEAGVLTPELLQKMRELIKHNHYRSHSKAVALLADSKFYAVHRWQDLHTREEAHNFSRFDPENLSNPFSKEVFQWVSDHEDSHILELGSGYGNDLVTMAEHLKKAEFLGIDSSQTVVEETRKELVELGLNRRIQLVCGDYMKLLESLKGEGFSMVYAHSSLHYHPSKVLRHRVFPLIADTLRGGRKKGEPGKLMLGMKTAASASAQAPDKVQLLGNDHYHHCFDVKDSLFRLYPEKMEDVLRLIYPEFEINRAYTQKIEGYDWEGDTEEFCYVIATPRS